MKYFLILFGLLSVTAYAIDKPVHNPKVAPMTCNLQSVKSQMIDLIDTIMKQLIKNARPSQVVLIKTIKWPARGGHLLCEAQYRIWKTPAKRSWFFLVKDNNEYYEATMTHTPQGYKKGDKPPRINGKIVTNEAPPKKPKIIPMACNLEPIRAQVIEMFEMKVAATKQSMTDLNIVILSSVRQSGSKEVIVCECKYKLRKGDKVKTQVFSVRPINAFYDVTFLYP